MAHPEPGAPRPSTPARPVRASAVLGAALALPALALVVLGAGARRPPWTGDGAWTTPLQVLLGLAGLSLVAALVVALRNLPGGLPRAESGSRRSRWWFLGGAVAVGAVAWLSGVAPRDPDSPDAADIALDLPAGFSAEGLEPLTATPTTVVAGLVVLGLLVLLVVVMTRGQPRGSSGGAAGAGPDGVALSRQGTDESGHVPAGPPDAVVLAAWAAGRRAVVDGLGAGEHDPPGRLLGRVAGSGLAGPLQRLTSLYLPVRFGRTTATEGDAAAARRALAELRQRLVAIEADR